MAESVQWSHSQVSVSVCGIENLNSLVAHMHLSTVPIMQGTATHNAMSSQICRFRNALPYDAIHSSFKFPFICHIKSYWV